MESKLNPSIINWANQTFDKIDKKMLHVEKRNRGKIPYVSENGIYNDMNSNNICWWTNGFYAGEMWLLYRATNCIDYKTSAEQVEALLDCAFKEFNGLHHDVGFMWLYTSIENYKLTKDSTSLKRGFHAASLLAGRFNLNGRFLRSWNNDFYGWTIIDSMMNLPLLYWASIESGDPRFKQIAMAHADTVSEYLVRPDGSVGHIASFNPENGEFIELIGGQGYNPDSSWSRGQAWALYGFALSYSYTKKEEYLNMAKKIANYFIANVTQNNYDVLIDFKAPVEPIKFDTSAGVCAACGMLEIAHHSNDFEKNLYLNAAIRILMTTEKKWADWSLDSDGIIHGVSHSYHQEKETHTSIVYGDYYFIEGIIRLINYK